MKTIRCKIWKATRAKQAALEGEYDNLQLYLQTGVDDGLYSANKQQADRYFKKIKKGKQESKIVKKKSGFYIHITIHKEKAPKTSCSSIIAIDLGERVIATVCNSLDMRPIFMGREVRGIRRHFAWLRKKLGEKKLRKEIKRIGQKEQRKVDAYLHAISRNYKLTQMIEYKAKWEGILTEPFLVRGTEYISAAGAPVNVPITEPFLVSSEAPCNS